MLSYEELLNKWNNIQSFDGGGYIRIDSEHPLDIYIGYEDINQKSFLLVADSEPPEVASSKSILAAIGKRHDGRWSLSLRLIKGDQESVYVLLCCDLIESTREASNNDEGMVRLIDRYNQWQKLMEHQSKGYLSEPMRRGLMGELIYIKCRIEAGHDPGTVVSGWIGPEGADQDFIYASGWYEVKAIGIAATSVKISSLQQLQADPPGELVLCMLDKTAPDDLKGFSLKDMVDDIRTRILHNSSAAALFETKLFRYGYIDIKEYGMQKYKFGGLVSYLVDEHFPKLIRSNVSPEITTVSYELGLSGIEPWKTLP